MHERKTLPVRNPNKPTLERLPCRLTRDEKLARMERRLGLERTVSALDAQIEAIKARAKADADLVREKRAEFAAEMVSLREQILEGFEERMVECLLLEDMNAAKIYVLRLDEGRVCQAKDMEPRELDDLRQRLPLEDRVMRTIDIPEDVEEVKRFDSDPPGVGDEVPSTYGHEHEYDDGACLTCGEVDPDYEAPVEATKPTRRKRGEGKAAKGSGKGYDTRAAH